MNLDLTTVIRFLRPALVALVGMLAPGTREYFLGQMLLQILGQFQASGGHPAFSSHAALGVDLPPEHEWTPEGIEKWADENADAGPDNAA